MDQNLPLKTILFCSPTRREGNSTVLMHFSQTLAAEGSKVLLVDANLRDSNLHKAFHLQRENGLTELVSEQRPRDFDHFIKETSLENLYVITSGSPHPNPCSVFESDYFGTLLDQLKVQWDWVLIDSPAITSCSDSNALASKVDGIILVIQAEKTRWEVGQEIRAQLENCGGRILGVILNKRRLPIPRWIYRAL
jgi:capsular exopolysaccharide synthesis family protein